MRSFRCKRKKKIGLIPYSLLASGRLICVWSEDTLRSETDETKNLSTVCRNITTVLLWNELQSYLKNMVGQDPKTALAWLLQSELVAAPITGATKISHLENLVGTLSIMLTTQEVGLLEEPYVPHPVVGTLSSKSYCFSNTFLKVKP